MLIPSNLPFLSPKIQEILQTIKDSDDIKYIYSKDRHLIPLVEKCLLHSKYNPIGEAKRIDFGVPDHPDQITIALGLGAGYHLVEHAKIKPLVVIPLDYQLLKSVLSQIDLEQFFEQQSLIIINEDEVLHYLDFSTGKKIHFIIQPVLQRIKQTEICIIQKKINHQISQILIEKNTIGKMNYIWLKNFLKNLYYCQKNSFTNEPLEINKKSILITGAGPSLDHNIEKIKHLKRELYIAATDTSYPILIKHKIVPDSVFSYDASPYSFYHFTDDTNQIKKTRLFIDTISPLASIALPKTLLFSEYPFNNFFNYLGFQQKKLSSQSRNIGGSMIAFFSNYFSNIPIITVGIDYANYLYQSYSQYTYQLDYKLIHGHFFKTENTFDSEFFYRNNYIQEKVNWKTTQLFHHYQSETVFENLYSLSQSPFISFKKINCLNTFLDNINLTRNNILNFQYPKIKTDTLKNKWKDFINSNNQTIKPLLKNLLDQGVKIDHLMHHIFE
ncbi:MAG: DUF115 domain-containing protein [Spirochaetes bacterium]|nr:DUF115 domain-containing protein [Spirochaetota bacterium]